MRKTKPIILTFIVSFFANSLYADGSKNQLIAEHALEEVFRIQKSKSIATVRDKLKRGEALSFNRGAFFKGTIPKFEKVLHRLPLKNLQIKDIPRGFMVTVGTGKDRAEVKVEFLDPLSGSLRVSGKEITIKKTMNYLAFARTLAPAVFLPLIKDGKGKKTTFIKSWNFLFPLAWSEEGSGAGDVIEPFIYFAAAESILPLDRSQSMIKFKKGKKVVIYMAAFLGVAYTLDFLYSVFYDLFTSRAEDNIAFIQESLDETLAFCQKSREQLYTKNDAEEYHVNRGKVGQLRGGHLQEIKDFQQLWEVIYQRQKRTSDSEELACIQLAKENGLNYLSKANLGIVNSVASFIPNIRSLTFRRKIRPICEKYQKVLDCFSSVPSLYGERSFIGETAIDGRGKSVLKEKSDSFESKPARGVLE